MKDNSLVLSLIVATTFPMMRPNNIYQSVAMIITSLIFLTNITYARDFKPLNIRVDTVVSEVETVDSNLDDFSKSIVSFGLLLMNNYVHICTGTIVGRRTILSAAHCVKNIDKYFNYAKGAGVREDKVKLIMVTDHKLTDSSYSKKSSIEIVSWKDNINPKFTPNIKKADFDTAFLTLKTSTDLPIANVIRKDQILPNGTKIRTYGYNWVKLNSQLGYTESFIPKNIEKMVASSELESSLKDIFTLSQAGEVEDSGGSKEILTLVAIDRVSCPGSSGGPIAAFAGGSWQIAGVISGGGNAFGESCNEDSKIEINDPSISSKDVAEGFNDGTVGFEGNTLISGQGQWFFDFIFSINKNR